MIRPRAAGVGLSIYPGDPVQSRQRRPGAGGDPEGVAMQFRTYLRGGALFLGLGAAAFGLAACGGDDGGGGGTGSDEQYVGAICSALLTFQDDLAKVVAGAKGDETDEEAAKLIVEPLEKYLSNLKKAKPPADVKEYHNDVVAKTTDAVKKIKEDKNLDAFNEIQDSKEPPQKIKDRLNAAAEKNEDCVKADFTFGS